MQYRNFLTPHKAALEERHANNEEILPHHIFDGVDFSKDNRLLLNWAKREKLITERDIKDARRRAAIVALVGEYPSTPVEFVQLMAQQFDVRVKFNGLMTRIDLTTGDHRDLLSTDFARECRTLNASVKCGFHQSDINDAVEGWYRDERESRITAIQKEIAPRADFDWELLARTCFDCSETSPEFVASVLKKFVHQVVCKLNNKKVGHHLMPVLTGRQGTGKTYFLNHLFGPVAELSRSADFKAISDERMIDLWQSYIIFIDEMGYAEKSDVDVVKNVITAETLDRRPMRTNSIQPVRQRATLIGATNKSLSELIRDETGNRRFVALEYSPPEDQDFIASQNWLAAWQSIKHSDADPMDVHRDALNKVQEAARHFGPVEGWLRALNEGEENFNTHLQNGKIRIKELYDVYQGYREQVTAGRDPTHRTRDAFSKELARIMSQHPDICPLAKNRDSKGIYWTWRGPRALVVVHGGRS